MHPLAALAQELTHKYFGNKLEIGKFFIYREQGEGLGKAVRITDGQFLSNGRLSNFWYWKAVNPDGSLGEVGHGYGGNEPVFTEVTEEEAIAHARLQ